MNLALERRQFSEPEADVGHLELADIIDMEAVQSLMNDFHGLADIPVGVIDLKGNVLVGVGWQEICTKFHRVHPDSCAFCMESDAQLAADIPAGEHRLYKCKNNMWDMATPITVSGRQVGSLVIGQFFFDDETLDYDLFRAQARQYGFDEEEYLAAIKKVPRLSRKSVDATMTFLMRLASILSQLSYGNVRLAKSVAERDALMEALHGNMERLQLAIRAANAGTWEWDLRTNENTWSDELWKLYGLEPHCVRPSYAAWLDTIHPDDRAAAEQVVQEAMKKGAELHVEWRVRDRDGAIRWLLALGRPVRDANGELKQFTGIVMDLTERKRAEQALRESEAQLQTIVENMTEGLVVANIEGHLVHWNRAALEMHGFSNIAECQRYLPELADTFELSSMDGAILSVDQWPLARILYGETLRNVEINVHNKRKGWRRVFNYGGSLVRDPKGVPLLAVVAVSDITERKHAEQEQKRLVDNLARSNEDLQQFAYVASHDLQEPLRQVTSFVQLLDKRYRDRLDGAAVEYLDFIVEGSKRMSHLISDLLAFSRVDSAGQNRASVPVQAAIEQALHNLRMSIEENDAAITWDEMPALHADPGQLAQVFQNLIGNAIKFRGAEPPAVHIAATRNRKEWVFRVSDNGIGFDTKHAARIFQLFQRLHTRDAYPGTGIGLTICKRVIERHGGRIWTEATPGKGAVFYFTLPATDE